MSPLGGTNRNGDGAGRKDGPPSGEAERPFLFTDKRRFDPDTLAPRNVPDPGSAQADPGNPDNASAPISAIDTTELAEAQQEAAERTADLQRVTAEYANYRKRVDRDREQVVSAARASVLSEMLTVLDDVDRAEEHGDLTGAFKAVADKLIGTLTKLGLARQGAVGEGFDPARHEAVQFSTSGEVTVPTVTAVYRHGYAIGERLIRPSVVVVTGPEHDAAPDAEPAPTEAPTDDADGGEGRADSTGS